MRCVVYDLQKTNSVRIPLTKGTSHGDSQYDTDEELERLL